MITKLLHDITQLDYRVEFSNDFEGMVNITYYDESNYIPLKYMYHEHLGYPDSKPEELDVAVISSLQDFLSKCQEERIQKDGLNE